MARTKQSLLKGKQYLIDTQVFIWWMEKSNRLSEDNFTLLNDPHNQIFLSVASVWEIIIKKQKKKLKLPVSLEKGIKFSDFTLLSIELSDVLKIASLKPLHNDPFDRILVAQSKSRGLTLITKDPRLQDYGGKILKA